MDDDRFDQMSADWDEASQTLFKCRLKRLKTMDFLLKAMIGAKTGESVSSDDIFEAWVPYLAKPSEAWDFARGLPSEAQVLQSLSQAKTPKGKEIDEVFGSQVFNWTQHFEVLMAGKHLTERSYRDLATIVDARVMLSQFAGEKNQDFERLAHKWAQKVMALNSNASRDEILTASSDVLKPQDVVTNVKRMRDQLGLLTYRTSGHQKKLRYVIARSEINLQGHYLKRKHSSIKEMMKTSPDPVEGWHLDHVFPNSESRRVDFPMTEVPNQATKEQVINSLGNLILLAPRENMSQQDALPNDGVKLKNLRGSLVYLNPILTDQSGWGENLTSDPKIREGLLKVQAGDALLNTTWGPESIALRQRTYYELFVEDILRDLGFELQELNLA